MTDLDRLRDVHSRMKTELHRVIVGQDEVIDQLLVALLAGGHCLLEGVPGLAKTLLVSSLSRTLDLDFHRIQFTPDLMPSDITGTELLHVDPETSTRSFRFEPGPVFTNVVLADEINRTPPKTQAALLEAMVERQVTSAGTCHKLPDPFFVLATQNPIEQEGTYPLPEAQLDRFMFMVQVNYPSHDEEREILRRTTGTESDTPEPVIDSQGLKDLQAVVRAIPVADHGHRFHLVDHAAHPPEPLTRLYGVATQQKRSDHHQLRLAFRRRPDDRGRMRARRLGAINTPLLATGRGLHRLRER